MSKLLLAAVALRRPCILRSESCFTGRAADVAFVSQAIPAAFMGSARFGCCDPDVRPDLKPLFSEVLSVVRMVFLLLSGLGLREVCFDGTARVGADDSGAEYGSKCGTLLALSFSVSELVLVYRACRGGTGGAGFDRSGTRNGATVPSPSQLLDLPIGGPSIDLPFSSFFRGPSSLPAFAASLRLSFNASSRSTRSLHCISSCFKESCSALSVSFFGM